LITQLKEDGVAESDIQVIRSADCRYAGQGYELRVDLPSGHLDEVTIMEALNEFHDSHKVEYGHNFLDSPIEIVNIRVTGKGVMPKIEKKSIHHNYQLEDALLKTGETIFNIDGNLEKLETKFYQREKIPVETEFYGPCIVLQKDSTTVIPPDCIASIEEYGNIIIKVGV
jgi:N-methylhydantoinase A